jgi:hypothetical protein
VTLEKPLKFFFNFFVFIKKKLRMTSDEVNLWRLACVLVFIMALSALVVGSLAYTRSNNVNNPNEIFLGSTSLTDFAATQTVKTRNILGSTLAPAAITTAGTLFNGDVNVNSVSFTGQGLTLYSNTLGLYYLLEGSDTQHELGTTDFTTLALTGVVTSVGQTTTIPDGNITNAMLANAALSNFSGTVGATTNTGTLAVTGATTLSTTLAVTGNTTASGSLTVSGVGNLNGGIHVPAPYSGIATLTAGIASVTGMPTITATSRVFLYNPRSGGASASVGVPCATIVPNVGFDIDSLNALGTIVNEVYVVWYLVIL